MEKFLRTLQTDAWRTSGARYNAARRLRRRELFATVSLTFFSALSVAVAFIQRVYLTISGSPLDNYLTALSACLGVFLLAISLMEWGAANGVKADALHRNAEELNGFQRRLALVLAQLAALQPLSWVQVEALSVEYEKLKGQCIYNHSPLDELHFRATKRAAPEFKNADGKPSICGAEAGWIAAQWQIASVWYFAVFWIVIGFALLAALLLPGLPQMAM